MAVLSQTSGISESKVRSVWRIDLLLVLAAAVLLAIGLMSLYSVSMPRPGAWGARQPYFQKQLVWLALGTVPFALFFFVHPKVWQSITAWIYGLNLVMLVAVLRLGRHAGGAQRWIEVGGFQFQPSEMAKILTVLTLAAFFATRQDELHRLSTFALSFLHIAAPLALVFLQPHLGASLVIIVIWLSVCVGAGVPLKFVFGSILGAFLVLGLAWNIPGVIKPYQKARVLAMFQQDEKGNAFQPLRAQIAFGVGGITGVGYGNGEQKGGGFIPEQHNDFIFTVIGEEGGLVGCSIVLVAFGFFFYRAWVIMFRATEPFLKMTAVGILGMLAFHAIVNMGMNLQLLPVVGLWLPFMSYGGTALWLCLSCVALLLNIRRHERPVLF